jgi:ABC-2 type transport system ATP-binding protein
MSKTVEPVIRTQDLSKSYNDVKALRELSLSVPQHSIFGFLGPNGAGKTTAIKLLLGLIRPTSGTGSVFGHDIGRDNLAVRARTGYLAATARVLQRTDRARDASLHSQFFLLRSTSLARRARE